MLCRFPPWPGGLVLMALALLAGASAQAAEDCSNLARIPDCPPIPRPCTAVTCPPQDCATCTPAQDDDLDCVIDEELLNGQDDDGDGLVDEDISCLNTCDPLNYACPSALFPVADLTAPHPVAAPVVLAARVRQYACGGAAIDQDFTLTLEPDPVQPVQFCGGFRAILTVSDTTTGIAWLRGPALLVLTRRWESLDGTLLDPPAPGSVAFSRHAVRADLAPLVPFASLPAALSIPCLGSPPGFFHVFFAGHLDLAWDVADPTRQRRALVLHHSPSRLSHPPATLVGSGCESDTITGRPLVTGAAGSHDGGWFLVAPAAGFTFAQDAAVPTGDFRHGRIRSLPTGVNEPCEKETRICVSQFEIPRPPVPSTDCGGAELLRHVRFCGNQPDGQCSEFALSSDTRCATIPSDLVAFFPVGRWSGTAFPGGMYVTAYEGAVSCVPPAATAWRPYWYGSYTRFARPGVWPGPLDALDVVDNMTVNPMGSGLWLIGACNWVLEGTPQAMFRPVQFRAMHYFADQNPDIPTLAPCAATAVITDAAAAGCATPPSLCAGDSGPLVLSAACSLLVNCCQCGGLETQWSRDDGGVPTVLAPWGPQLELSLDSPPAAPTTYRLEVRCSNSRTACVSSAEVTLGPTSVTAFLGAGPGCNGQALLDAGSSNAAACGGGLEYRFLDPLGGIALDWSVTSTLDATVEGDWTVEVRCASSPRCEDSATARVTMTSVEARAMAPLGCDVASVVLDATSTLASCGGPVEWRFVDPLGMERQPFLADPDLDADAAGDWTIEARCSDTPTCVSSTTVSVVLEATPTLGAPTAVDEDPCAEGLRITWPTAVFPSGDGTYALYRSSVSCADAAARPPLTSGLTATGYSDVAGAPGTPWFYVVEAEDGVPTTACSPAGPTNGGSVARACVGPLTDAVGAPAPALAWWPLRVGHVGQAVTLDWSRVRPLVSGEHFHVRKDTDAALGSFPVVNAEGDTMLTHAETDVSAALQFFDVRIASLCEDESADDEPPGYDPPMNGCP